MVSEKASSGPVSAPASGGGVTLPPTIEKLQYSFENGVWYLLSLWPAMHVALQNGWGGPDSADKRDWFAGAISDLFGSNPDTDLSDLQIFMLQVMADEFECDIDDDSEEDVAQDILRLRRRLLDEKDLAAFQELEMRWRNRGQMKVNMRHVHNHNADDVDDDDEPDGLDDDDDDDDDDGDVNMQDSADVALNSVLATKERAEPEVDEDGFTKVTSKKKR